MSTKYELKINGGAGGKAYQLSYGNKKKIDLRFENQKVTINTELTKDYSVNFNNSYAMGLLKEGVRRSALVIVLRYKNDLKVNMAVVKISTGKDQMKEIDLTDEMQIISLLQGNLKSIPKTFDSDEVVQSILSGVRSKCERKTAALYAYLFSKTKEFEIERFTYLWVAFNGYYAEINNENKENDKQGMEHLLTEIGRGKEIFTKNSGKRDSVGKKVKLLLEKEKTQPTRESLESGEHQVLAAKIQSYLKTDKGQLKLTPYGYLLTDFAYYLRCSLFHAQTPMLLYSFENDMDLKALKTVNWLLEDFLDQNLVKCYLNKGGEAK